MEIFEFKFQFSVAENQCYSTVVKLAIYKG